MSHALLRRTAEALYSAGRHLERAENIARVVLVHGDTHVDLPVGEDIGWAPLLEVAGAERDFVDAYPAFASTRRDAPPSALAPEGEVVDFLLCAAGNPQSVLASVERVREAFRSSRSVVPREAWELTNTLVTTLREHRQTVWWRDGRVRWLRRTIGECERINGALWGSMRRDAATAITRTGQHLERAALTCRFLAVRADGALADLRAGDPYEQVRSMSLLRSLASYQQFQRATSTRQVGSIAEFMLRDEALPRTVAGSLAQVRQHLKELPFHEEALSVCTDASVMTAGSIVRGMSAEELREHLGRLGALIEEIDARIRAQLFVQPGNDVDSPPAATTSPASPQVLGRFRVMHRTTYRYESSAEESVSEAHLRPRQTVRQRVVSSRIEVTPEPDAQSEVADSLGNHVTAFIVRGPFRELTVTATSEIEVFRLPPPPIGPPWESVCLTLDRDRRIDTRTARNFRAASRLVPVNAELADYAEISFEPRRPVVEAVRDLCGRIHSDFTYQPGFTSVTTPVLEVFAQRRGVCQDFAHVAVGCLRSVGLAARYVSGYIETFRRSGDELTGADASHAWASVYLPGWGWLDLDPTNAVVGCEEHLTTAWGRDYLDVSPLRGSVVGGGRAHDLDVAVQVARLVD